MKRLLYLAVLSLGSMLVLTPAALAQDPYDCGDFTYQEDAQAVFDQDPNDPSGLDGPRGPTPDGEPGVACENLPSRGDTTEQPQAKEKQESSSEKSSSEKSSSKESSSKESTTTKEQRKELPATGGLSLLLPTAALLIGSGILVSVALRRR